MPSFSVRVFVSTRYHMAISFWVKRLGATDMRLDITNFTDNDETSLEYDFKDCVSLRGTMWVGVDILQLPYIPTRGRQEHLIPSR